MRILVFSLLMITTLAACGQNEQTKEDRRVDRQHALADSLNGRMPNEAWTEAQLKAYGDDLDALDRVDRGLNAGKIQARRTQLAAIRELKTRKSAQDLLVAYGAAVDAFEKDYVNNPDTTVVDVPAANRELDRVLALNARVLALPILEASERAQFEGARQSLEALRSSLGKPAGEANAK